MAKSTLVYHPHHHFEWSPVFAGAVIACAISLILMQFGAAIGLADDAPLRGVGSIASWGVIAVGIWLLWVQLLASLAGGYTAGYLRAVSPEATAHENELRDGLYGLSVWALSSVAVFIVVSIASAISMHFQIATETLDMSETISETEQNTAVIFAFVLGATSLLSAVAAWWAATMGGEHRANGTDFSKYLTFKK